MTRDLPTMTVKINHELLEEVILSFLFGNSLITAKHLALGIDLGMEMDDNGFIDLEVIYEDLPDDWLDQPIYIEEDPYAIFDEDDEVPVN